MNTEHGHRKAKRAIDVQRGDRLVAPAKDGGLLIVESNTCCAMLLGFRRICGAAPNSGEPGRSLILIVREDVMCTLV